jgi:F-type H+/Na+-transporting ATPase subunit alpha
MNNAKEEFQKLVNEGQPVGEVIAVHKFFVKVKGLHPISVQSLVLFDDGTQGYVRATNSEYVSIFSMGPTPVLVGAVVVKYSERLVTPVGEGLIGRVISPLGVPLDDKGPLKATSTWPIFNVAPAIHEREVLNELLETGVAMVDSLFPIVKGQRLAIIGDMKGGKTTLATQVGMYQKNSDAVVIYTLIAKRQGDIDELVTTLEKNGSLSKSIVIATTIFDSLVTSYLAPYVACAIGEYFWQEKDRDAVVIYDDLTSHAQIYREISLISGTNPGRDSYPGDIFYIHSSLLERAGKLHRNHKTLTALPVVLAGGGDVTAFLPTNIISITDGQWILDSEVFKEGFRPAVSSSLSVTRVGGRGHTNRQKDVAGRIQRALSAYRQALEYSHFGAELSTVTMNDLRIGTILKAVLNQLPGEAYPLLAQQLLIETILDSTPDTKLPDISELKAQALMHSEGISSSLSYEDVLALFKKQYGVKG